MIIFAGPSLNNTSLQLAAEPGIELCPPVRRGDIRKITEERDPGEIAIVDGVFHQVLAVGHEEILDAIEIGWQVWGLSSMGAIRAYELRDFGMKGYGKVYHRFFSMEDFQDDELALLHEPEPPYRAFSEPLVHFRACVEYLLEEQMIDQGPAESVIAELKSRYFGERTHAFFHELTSPFLDDPSIITHNFDRFREKQSDLLEFLRFMKERRSHEPS